jgi:hypothetical protein
MAEESIKEQFEKKLAKGLGDVEGRFERRVAEALNEKCEMDVSQGQKTMRRICVLGWDFSLS